MKTRHISFILLLLLLLMGVIYYLSSQPADESTLTSSHFCTLAAKFLFSDYSSYDTQIQKTIIKGLTHVVRKMAHFSEYTLMGFLWYLLLRKKKGNILFSILATACYAASDELHQKFVAGRSAQVSDVILDTCGGCFGVLLAFLLLCVWYSCRNKEIMEYGVWKTPEHHIKN